MKRNVFAVFTTSEVAVMSTYMHLDKPMLELLGELDFDPVDGGIFRVEMDQQCAADRLAQIQRYTASMDDKAQGRALKREFKNAAGRLSQSLQTARELQSRQSQAPAWRRDDPARDLLSNTGP